MPKHPLFTDHSIALSTTLAATIGLEDAVLLTVLSDAARSQDNSPTKLSNETLRQQLPFWDDVTIRTRLRSLTDKGLIFMSGALFPDASSIQYSFQEAQNIQAAEPKASNLNMPQTSWTPSEETFQRLEQHGISRAFCLNQLDGFVLQSKEQGGSAQDWNSRYFRYIKRQWVYTQNSAARFQRTHESGLAPHQERTAFQPQKQEAEKIQHNWQPSEDAKTILQRADIDEQFIIDAIPEFILYWSERGEAHKTWNSKFIHHVRQQWVRFTTSVEHSSLPSRIAPDWQPVNDCYDILQLAHIPKEFAQALVGEFVLYWRDSNQVHNSWNSRFLQYVKQQWGKRLPMNSGDSNGQQNDHQPGYSTAEASRKRLQDTSW